MPQNDTLYRLQNLTLAFHGRPALHHISGEIRRGESYAILGPNGSGKSSLLRLLAGEIQRWEGQFECFLRPAEIGYLAQTSLLNQEVPVTIEQVVSQGLWPELPWRWSAFTKSAQARIEEALRKVNLVSQRNEIWGTLSGGLRQRALIARLLVQKPQVLLLDEPFNSLDPTSSDQLCAIFQQLQSQGLTLIVVLHNEDIARRFFPHVVVLNRDLNYWGPTALSPAPLILDGSNLAPCPPPHEVS